MQPQTHTDRTTDINIEQIIYIRVYIYIYIYIYAPTQYTPDQHNSNINKCRLYMQPQTHTERTTVCNTEKILFYLIVKRQYF